MKLFEIKTKNYKTYYALAGSFSEAEKKTKMKISLEIEEDGILAEDGSLKTEDDKDFIRDINLLTDNLIR